MRIYLKRKLIIIVQWRKESLIFVADIVYRNGNNGISFLLIFDFFQVILPNIRDIGDTTEVKKNKIK